MGREAVCSIRHGGEAAEGKALLEAAEVILRGPIRARLPRASLTGWSVDGGTLRLDTGGGTYELDLGPVEAAAWDKALAKPPPDLGAKLGLGPDRPGWVMGRVEDADLAAALAGAEAADPSAAALLLALILSPPDLAAALALADAHPAKPVWAIHAKGKAAAPPDADIRAAFRDAGYVDTKACAVSARLTATRYNRRA